MPRADDRRRAVRSDADELTRAIANLGGAYRAWAEGLGRRTRIWDDLSCADLELPVALPPNNATLLRPPDPGAADALLERIASFFAERPGGGYEIWSLWPIPGLSPGGEGSVPCMVRDPGGAIPSAPAELEIVEATDASTVAQAEALIDEVFEVRARPGSVLTEPCLGERFRVWVGRVDGRPVTTATAYIGDGYVGVYAVATIGDVRGRGYGEAVTWAATTCRPELPATLQASPMGRPVYERMGYRTIAELTVWERERDHRVALGPETGPIT